MADFNNYYRVYMDMQNLLGGDFTHNYLVETLQADDNGADTHSGKMYTRVIDMEWVETIEETIVYIDKAIREQRRFIEQTEDIVPIEKARKITSESVRHLAQHTSLIASVENGKVTPERILDIRREESFAIYENRFLHTLLNNVTRFVEERYKEMRNAPNDSYNKVHMERQITVNGHKLNFDVTYSNESHEREKIDLDEDVSQLTDFERVRRIRRVLSDFVASPLMRNLSGCEPVRPPILHTNLMTKNTNFKKALDLWLFIETYRKKGFEVEGKEYSGKMEEDVKRELYNVLAFQHFAMQIASNKALRTMLQEKYEEENNRIAQNQNKDEKELQFEKKLKTVREEEMQIRLAEILAREKQIKELNGQLDHQKISLHSMELKVKEYKATVAYNQEILNQNKEQITALQTAVLKSENTIKEQQENLENLNIQLAECKQTISEKQLEIDTLNSKLAQCNSQIEQLSAQINALTAEKENQLLVIAKLEKDLAFANENLQAEKELNAKLKSKNAQQQANIDKANTTIEQLKADNIATVEEANNNKLAFEQKLAEEQALNLQRISDSKAQFDLQIKKLEQQHQKELATANVKFESEKTKIAHLAESKIKQQEKQQKHIFEQQAKEVKESAKQKIAQANKQAQEKINISAKINRFDSKRVLSVFNSDFSVGTAALTALYCKSQLNNGAENVANNLVKQSGKTATLLLINNGKNITVNSFYKGNATVKEKINTNNFADCAEKINLHIQAHKVQCAVLTSSSADKEIAEQLAEYLVNEKIFESVECTAEQKPHLPGNYKSILGIYYYRE